MLEEKKIVDSNKNTATTKFDAASYHAANFFNTIKDFYDLSSPSDVVDVNNDLLLNYLEKGLEDNTFNKTHLQNVAFMVSNQNKFLVKLKESYDACKKFTNLKIEQI